MMELKSGFMTGLKVGLKVILFAPEWYWLIPESEREKGSCGPGSGFGEWLVPETIWGMPYTDCCQIHDKMYDKKWNPDIKNALLLNELERTKRLLEIKDEADRVFLNNILRKIDFYSANNLMRAIRKRRAFTIYDAVSLGGGPAYWNDKNEPNEWGA